MKTVDRYYQSWLDDAKLKHHLAKEEYYKSIFTKSYKAKGEAYLKALDEFERAFFIVYKTM